MRRRDEVLLIVASGSFGLSLIRRIHTSALIRIECAFDPDRIESVASTRNAHSSEPNFDSHKSIHLRR